MGIQAMSLGVPVIARNVPGNKGLVTNNCNGLLFDDEEVDLWMIFALIYLRRD